MMNRTDSQLDSVNEVSSCELIQQQHEMHNEEKPLGLDQQQHEINNEEKPLSLDQQQHEMNNAEKPLSLNQQQHETINVVDSHASSGRDYSRPNLPIMDLVRGTRQRYLEIGVPLYKASVKGDWKAAKVAEVENFVKNLVSLMERDDLALENKNYNTALYLAAAGGNIKSVKTMMEKNENLHIIPGGGSPNQPPTLMPLYTAVLFGNYEVVKYLYEQSNDLRDDDG
ncbi:ankyrin repeat-containing domain, PGG domain protein [Tanacetum coccineum]